MWPSVALYELTRQNNRVASLVLSQNEHVCLSEHPLLFTVRKRPFGPDSSMTNCAGSPIKTFSNFEAIRLRYQNILLGQFHPMSVAQFWCSVARWLQIKPNDPTLSSKQDFYRAPQVGS